MSEGSDYSDFEHHYFRTSPECDSETASWEELGGYLAKHANDRLVYFREVPQVLTEIDFDTKSCRYVGFVRFYAGPKRLREFPTILGFENVECKA